MSERHGAASQTPRVDVADGLHSGLPSDHRAATGRRPQASAMLELVDELTDKEIDLNALHDALAALLVRYHHKMHSSQVPAR